MRFESSTNASSTLFSDQVNKVVDLFHEWNDCERSVAMYAILKRIPFACAKFLQSVIDTNLTQTYCLEQTKLLEHNANSATFIQRLSETYKNYKSCGNQSQQQLQQQQLNNNKDSLFYESDTINAGSSQKLTSSTTTITTNNDGRGGGGGGVGGVGLVTRGGSGCDLVSGGTTNLNEISDKFYEKKEDILKDILTLMPILTPGNDEAKLAYLEFIPITVEDAIRGTVNATLVQQIFSYLLIHPAFTTNDRRSLSKFLRHLEDHIVSTDPNFVLYPNGQTSSSSSSSTTTAATTGGTTTSDITTGSLSLANNWQAIAPPQSKSTETILSWDGSQHHLTGSNNVISVNTSNSNLSSSASKTILCSNGATGTTGSIGGNSVSGIGGSNNSISGSCSGSNNGGTVVGGGGGGGVGGNNVVVTGTVVPFVVDDVTAEYQCSKTLVGNIIEFKSTPGSSPKLGLLYESTADDHDISFSKNGTEIIDFDCDDTDKSNTQIGFDTLANLNEFLTVPGIIDNITLKTRRSNSLTTTGSIKTAASYTTSSSAQNLNNLVQKPRSFSLSMVGPRSSLTSSGSDTRLDDFKPNYSKFPQHNIGMSNIGQWLKSLRLHKYVWLFSNITYDQMLDITEEYLQNLNVTKGARHKLVVCIQKLKERHGVLCQLEKDLMTGKVTFGNALDELSGVVLTPMKPVEHLNKQDIGGQFLKVLNLVSTMIISKHITPQDEEPINLLLWILEKAVHNEAFVAHTNQLKEHRYKVSRIKVQFPPKSHFGNTNNNNNNGNGGQQNTNNQTNNTINSKTATSCSSSGNLTRSSTISKLDFFGYSSRNFENTNNDLRRLSIDSGYSASYKFSSSTESINSINSIQSPTLATPFNQNPFNSTTTSNTFNSTVGNKSFKSVIQQSQTLQAALLPEPSKQLPPQQPLQQKLSQKQPPQSKLPQQQKPSSYQQPLSIQNYNIEYPYMEKLATYAEQINSNKTVDNLNDLNIENDKNKQNQQIENVESLNFVNINKILVDSNNLIVENNDIFKYIPPALLSPPSTSTTTTTTKPQSSSVISVNKDLDLKLPTIKQQLKIAPEFIPAKKRIINLKPTTQIINVTAAAASAFTQASNSLPLLDRPTFASVTSGLNSTKLFDTPIDIVNSQFNSNLANLFKPQHSLLMPINSTNVQKTTGGNNNNNNNGNTVSKIGLWMRSLNNVEQKPTTSQIYGSLNNASHYQYQKHQQQPQPQQHQQKHYQQHQPQQTHHHHQQHQKKQPPKPIPVQATVTLKLGMSQIPIWLKSLRLHKYQWIFNEMSYENMLHLTEDYLENLNVTKGARNKLILSIKKLCGRYSIMDTMEKDIIAAEQILITNDLKLKLLEILDELIYIVQTPMKPVQLYNSTDVASKFLKILNLVYEKIMTPPPIRTFINQPDDDLIYKLAFIIDKALVGEGFGGYITKLRKMRQKLPDCKKYSRKD